MENEFMKRGYLLPKGCKDLTDVVKLKQENISNFFRPSLPDKTPIYESAMISWKKSDPLAPLMRQIFVSPQTTVKKLAALLGQEPFKIICDLLELGTFASATDLLDFKMISVIARKYGFATIKSG